MKNVSQQKSQKSKNVNVKQKRWPTKETDILYPHLTKKLYLKNGYSKSFAL